MEIYSAEGKRLEDTVLSLLDRNLGRNRHICQDNFYNSVRLAQTLLGRYVRVRHYEGQQGHSMTGKVSTRKEGRQHSGGKVT
jgi:hypothetical protein